MSNFIAATTYPLKWSVGDNRFAKEGDTQTKSLSLFIPQECMAEFASYINRLAGETDKLRSGKTYDHTNQEEIEVQGFYINAKGAESKYGPFGNINLAQIPAKTPVGAGASSAEIPF